MNETQCNDHLWRILKLPEFGKFHEFLDLVKPREPVSDASILEIMQHSVQNNTSEIKNRIQIPIFCCKSTDVFFQLDNVGQEKDTLQVSNPTTSSDNRDLHVSTMQTLSKAQYTSPPSLLRIHYDQLRITEIDEVSDRANKEWNPHSTDDVIPNDTIEDLKTTMKHELVHAMDHRINMLDLQTCGGLACSEVRASSVAECAKYPLNSWRRKECTKHYSKLSSEMSFPTIGKTCVSRVFSACYDPENVDGMNNPTSLEKFHTLMQSEVKRQE
jgi:Peptidase M76 family